MMLVKTSLEQPTRKYLKVKLALGGCNITNDSQNVMHLP